MRDNAPPALSRAELIDLVLAAATDEITNGSETKVLRPNILVVGCTHVRGFRNSYYPDPEAAARHFAGKIADAVLERLGRREAAA